MKENNNIYSELLEKYSKVIDEKDISENRICCCRKGCKGCCHQLIIISNFEKEIIKNTIYKMPLKEQKKIYKIVNEELEILIKNKLTYGYIMPDIPPQIVADIQKKYFNLNIRCPFLNEKDSCIIYKERPMSCMTYRNYGNPSDCTKNVFVKKSITFNNIEQDMRIELLYETNQKIDGFNILQFAMKEIFNNMNILKKIYFLI